MCTDVWPTHRRPVLGPATAIRTAPTLDRPGKLETPRATDGNLNDRMKAGRLTTGKAKKRRSRDPSAGRRAYIRAITNDHATLNSLNGYSK